MMSRCGDSALARKPSWILWLLAAALTFHGLAILQTLIPDWGLWARFFPEPPPRFAPMNAGERDEMVAKARKVAAYPPIRPLDSVFFNYKVLTGTRQDWQMFQLPPRDSNLEVVLELRDSEGKTHTMGPVMPGFEDVDVLSDGRYYHLWGRYEFWNETSYIQTYLENMGRLLKKSEDPVYKDLKLIYRKHLIQPPESIAESGEISKVSIREWWLPRDAWKD